MQVQVCKYYDHECSVAFNATFVYAAAATVEGGVMAISLTSLQNVLSLSAPYLTNLGGCFCVVNLRQYANTGTARIVG